MKVLFILLTSLIPFILLAQEETIPERQQHECGTTLAEDSRALIQRESDERWQEERAYYTDMLRDYQSSSSRNSSTIRMVPVQLHTIRTTAGTGGISDAAYEKALAQANEYFIIGGIYLYQCSNINYIDNDTYYDYNKTQKVALDAAYAISDVLNIYVANTVTSGTSTICGHAEFPGGLDFAMLDLDCAQNGSTFAHEVGHYFNIYHTHQSGNELVDGSNCTTTGDRLCDTPADPNVSGLINDDGCIYIGSSTDLNGDTYAPSTINIMSYGDKDCRVEFTSDQYARMIFAIDNYRSYLSCSASLAAGFYSNFDESDCTENFTVDFCDVSAGSITSHAWDFGDGNTSTDAAPSHTYTTAGIYDVSLTVGDGASTDLENKSYEIVVGTVSVPYTEDFEAGTSVIGQFRTQATMKNKVSVDAAAANTGSYGLLLEGDENAGSQSPYYSTPSASTAFGEYWNQYYKSSASLCVDATNLDDLFLDFDLKQMHRYNDNYSNFRITIDGTQVIFYQSDGSETWSTKSLDLTAYVGGIITIGFEGSHKYHAEDNATFIDNISITGAVSLPVELIDFTVNSNQDMEAVLNWKTASETNNEGFFIQHSTDGISWTNLGFVNGKGTTSEIHQYTFTHPKPFIGTNYYRLQQIDFDGSFEYAEIKTLDIKGKQESLSIYPNPVDDLLTIYEENGQGTIYNLLGQSINTFTINNSSFSISTIHLPIGQYILQVKRENGETISQRFIKK